MLTIILRTYTWLVQVLNFCINMYYSKSNTLLKDHFS